MTNYLKIQILVVLLILGSLSGIYATHIVQHNNSGLNIDQLNKSGKSIDKVNIISPRGAKTIYVAKNGTDRNDGLTRDKPKRNIEIALESASSGDTIRIGPGTYQINLQIYKNITLIGEGNNTVIDGQKVDTCIYISSGVNVTINNIIIKNGKWTHNIQNKYGGGGICNIGTLNLENSTITDNNAECGGGIYNSGRMFIRAVTIRNNTAKNDGGGFFNSGTVNMSGVTITDNKAGGNGGGIHGSVINLSRVTIKNNTAEGDGGGIDSGYSVIEDSTITDNTAKHSGGGIKNGNNHNLVMIRVTIKNNTAKITGGGVQNDGSSTMEDSTIIYNTAGSGGGIYNSDLLYAYGLTISNNNGGGFYNYNGERSRAYIDDITIITGNIPDNFKGKPFIPA